MSSAVAEGFFRLSRPPPPSPSASRLRLGGFFVFFAKVSAGEHDEDVFEADLPGRQLRQGQAVRRQSVEQGGDRQVGLSDGQGERFGLGPACLDGRQVFENRTASGCDSAATANSTTCSPPIRAISSPGEPRAMTFP